MARNSNVVIVITSVYLCQQKYKVFMFIGVGYTTRGMLYLKQNPALPGIQQSLSTYLYINVHTIASIIWGSQFK